MRIQASAEDYLEAVYMLRSSLGRVRAIDIAHLLGFSKPSVSVALRQLEDGGYITRDTHGSILLTDTGEAVAKQVYARHDLLTGFLRSIGVSDGVARRDACRLEHYLSEESYNKLSEFCKRNG